jgi:spore coat polysaccharide biosynthesis protein SpsF (cytidylyltransferase family)
LNIHVIIQARLGSKRLPGKVLKSIGKYNSIELIYKRIGKSKLVNGIFFAIPNNKQNLSLKKFISQKINCEVFLGSEKNVLNRYYLAAKKFKSDIIIRITADCPLVDSDIIDEYIKILIKNNLDYVYNGAPHTYPDGLDVEVFTFKALKKANKNAEKLIQKDGVTRYFRDNLKKFETKHIKCPIKNISHLRITLDTKKDLTLIRKIYKFFNPKVIFSWKKIISFYKKNKVLFNN